MIVHESLDVPLVLPPRGVRAWRRDPTTVSGTELSADCVSPLDRWERLTFWLVLTVLAVAVVLNAWATTQLTLAELGQPIEHPVYEPIEPVVSEPPGLPK